MVKHLFIITGASRGMGLAMAQQLLSPEHFLLCVSRHENPALAADAQAVGCGLEQWPLNLDHTQEAAAMLTQWLSSRKTGSFASATLVNNAALLPRIGPVAKALAPDISNVIRVGLEAPMQLAAVFLRGTERWTSADGLPVTRKLLNISSGNGRNAMASQALYSAAKAGLDHFTRCLALEEAAKPHGAKVCSLAPGVVDTDMQAHLRSTPAQDFPNRERFMNLKAQGQLASAEQGAARVLAYLARADFGDSAVGDVRDFAEGAG